MPVRVSVCLFLLLTFPEEYMVASDSLCVFICCALKLSLIHSPSKVPMALPGVFLQGIAARRNAARERESLFPVSVYLQ